MVKKKSLIGRSGFGPVGRVVASHIRGPWFESSHQQRRGKEKKRPGTAH